MQFCGRYTKECPKLLKGISMDYERKRRNVTYHSASCKMYLRHDFKHRCAYCGVIEEFKSPIPEVADESFEKDHFIPQHDNPPAPHGYSNLYYACTRCNNKKDAISLPLDPCADDIFSGEAPYIEGGTADVNYLLSSESAEGNEYIASLGLNSRYHVTIREEQEAWLRAHEESERILQELQDKQALDPEDLKLMAIRLGISSHADPYKHLCGGSEYAIHFAEACRYLESNGYQPEIKFSENELDITAVIGGTTYWGTVRISDTVKDCHLKTAILSEREKINAPYGIFTFVPTTKTMCFHKIDFDNVDWSKKEYRTSAYVQL